MYNMSGMPMKAIVPDTGRGVPDICDKRSAPRHIMLPQSIAPAIVLLCEELPVAHLAICGATIPANPMGPQNAVTAPVQRQQLNMASSLMWRGSAPAAAANSSPKSKMSSPFILTSAAAHPVQIAAAIMMICGHVTKEKLPADQL